MTRFAHLLNRLPLAAALAAIPAATPAAAQAPFTCGPATLQRIEAMTDAGASRPTYVVTMRFDERLYSSRPSNDAPGTLGPEDLTFDDDFEICVNDREVVLERADGKDYRGQLVSVAHDPASPPVIAAARVPGALFSAAASSHRRRARS